MTKFIYSGSEKTPNGVVCHPGSVRGMEPSACQASEVLY